jgi:hypothetical protein
MLLTSSRYLPLLQAAGFPENDGSEAWNTRVFFWLTQQQWSGDYFLA